MLLNELAGQLGISKFPGVELKLLYVSHNMEATKPAKTSLINQKNSCYNVVTFYLNVAS